MNPIESYYSKYNEDSRLERHPVEFFTTTFILNQFAKPSDRVLDAAAGTGIYSLYYASKVKEIFAVDIIPQHIKKLNKRIISEQKDNIHTRIHDIRDLSLYHDEYFDLILYLGPIYHLSDEELLPALHEVVRVLKENGIIALSFINRYPGYELDKYREWFYFRSAIEIEQILANLPLDKKVVIPTDGPFYSELLKTMKIEIAEDIKIYDWIESNISKIDMDAINNCIHGLMIYKKKST